MRILRLFILVALLCCFFSSTAVAQDVEVRLTNNTGKTMTYLYISESGNQSWEDDILGVKYLGIRTLEHGYYCEFLIDGNTRWDLRAEFRDGTYHEYYDFHFGNNRRVTLNRDNATYE